MKKIVLLFTGFFIFLEINAQSLNEIVKKYTEVNKQDKVSSFSSIKITAKMSMMGMDLPMEMWMKNPDKIKTLTNVNGQEIVSVFDGTKGYSINPMTGSTTPIEMTPEQIKQTQRSNMFKNFMANYLKEGKLKLEGEENVNNKSAFKIKADLDGVNSSFMFIDKVTYYLVKTSSIINQDGRTVTIDSYPSDYKETNGVMFPMKTTSSAQGMEFTMVFTKIEVNIPMEDSIFKIK